MSPIRVDKQERRERILHGALAVFRKKPFDKVTVDDVAAEAGVAKGGVYLYFKSKDDLYMALLDHAFGEFFEEFALHPEIDDPVEQLEHVFLEGLEPWQKEQQFLRFFVFYLGKNMGTERGRMIEQRLRQSFARNRRHIEEIYRRGLAAGHFRKLDPAHVSATLVAMAEFIPMQWVIDKKAFSLREAGKAAFEIWLKGISRASTKHRPQGNQGKEEA